MGELPVETVDEMRGELKDVRRESYNLRKSLETFRSALKASEDPETQIEEPKEPQPNAPHPTPEPRATGPDARTPRTPLGNHIQDFDLDTPKVSTGSEEEHGITIDHTAEIPESTERIPSCCWLSCLRSAAQFMLGFSLVWFLIFCFEMGQEVGKGIVRKRVSQRIRVNRREYLTNVHQGTIMPLTQHSVDMKVAPCGTEHI